jgi:hypothetical protein
MQFVVGGESYEFDREDVERAMKGERPELIQKYVVEVSGVEYPPKQVFAKMTGRDRQSYTTMEAQRVLNRLGFEPYESGRRSAQVAPGPRAEATAAPAQPSTVESDIATIKLAIAELARRVIALEDGRAA